MTQMVLCEPGALGAQPSSHFVGVHSMRKGSASVGLAAGAYATCIIMAHGHDACALRNSPLPRLNRVKGTFLRAFSTLAQLSPSPCHALQVALHFSFFFHSFSLLLLAVSSLRGVLRAAAAALCAFCVVRCRCRCRCLTFLFEKERVKREEGERKCAVVVVVEGRRKEEGGEGLRAARRAQLTL